MLISCRETPDPTTSDWTRWIKITPAEAEHCLKLLGKPTSEAERFARAITVAEMFWFKNDSGRNRYIGDIVESAEHTARCACMPSSGVAEYFFDACRILGASYTLADSSLGIVASLAVSETYGERFEPAYRTITQLPQPLNARPMNERPTSYREDRVKSFQFLRAEHELYMK
jgi:hypothetical protein